MTAETPSIAMIVGLGNPGEAYEHTRHNAGFDVIDALYGACATRTPFERACSGQVATIRLGGRSIYLLKPHTFMNLSGDSVKQALNAYKLRPEEVIIVYDDLDLPLGLIRLRTQGSGGGHNGMNNIIEKTQTERMPRLRMGIGREDARNHQVDFVLSPFEHDEKPVFAASVKKAVDALKMAIVRGLDTAMNSCNHSERKEAEKNTSSVETQEKQVIETITNPDSGGPNIE